MSRGERDAGESAAQDVHRASRNDEDGHGRDQRLVAMKSFARWVSGIASVGLNAIELVTAI